MQNFIQHRRQISGLERQQRTINDGAEALKNFLQYAEPASAGDTLSQASAPSPVAAADAITKRCEFVDGNSSKFWHVTQTDTLLTIRYGRIGTQGQAMTKSFDTVARATAEREKLFAEKLRKDYKESG